jgi:hypothetical protein
MVHSAMVASIASPIVTRSLTAVDQPLAPIAHSLYDLNAYDPISPEAAEKESVAEWREGPAQPFEKARFAEGKSLDFPSPALDFPSLRLGFFFPWLGFSSPRFMRKENSAEDRSGDAGLRPQGQGPGRKACVTRGGRAEWREGVGRRREDPASSRGVGQECELSS